MNFAELTEEEFTNFADSHPQKSFFQTKEIAKLRHSNGWDYYYVGVKQNNHIVAATLLLSKKRKLGYYEFYAPRGFLCDYHNKELLKEFTNNIKKYIKQKKGYVLRIEPYICLKERDIDGKIVENGENNEAVITTLTNLGYQYDSESEQAKWMFVLDIDSKDSATIFKNMRQNTRNLIRKAEKNCIEIRELSREELPLFKKVTSATSDRRNFVDKSLKYYEDMYDLFHDKNYIKYMIAEVNLHTLLHSLNKEYSELQEKIKQYKESKKSEGKLKEALVLTESLQKRIDEVEEYLKDNEKLVLSVGSFILYGDEIIYLNSGNYKEYMHYNAQYLLQWTMIQYGIEHHYKRYNFYGISGNFDKNDSSYGIYEFKKGFNGYVIENIGTFNLPIRNIYYIHKLLNK